MGPFGSARWRDSVARTPRPSFGPRSRIGVILRPQGIELLRGSDAPAGSDSARSWTRFPPGRRLPPLQRCAGEETVRAPQEPPALKELIGATFAEWAAAHLATQAAPGVVDRTPATYTFDRQRHIRSPEPRGRRKESPECGPDGRLVRRSRTPRPERRRDARRGRGARRIRVLQNPVIRSGGTSRAFGLSWRVHGYGLRGI